MPDTGAATETGVTLAVDGRTISARQGELVIDAAERHGVYIPRFCYHPRMRPVGMCRMCIVEIDTGRGPALQPSCMIQVAPDMKVDTQSETTKKAQDGVLEFLLINHPLDCPVCDKGGECPLQDQTLSYGPGESRFIEEKRHFEKPILISDLVVLDRERCILCDRCTRFADEVAGDPLISFIDRGSQTQVNTFPGEPFSSYFSGNTVQICPVGALLPKTYRFKARPWDLEQTESTCTSCSVGCRLVIDASRNRVLRYNGVDIDPVNWSWLCDKGRFDFENIHHVDRLAAPLVRTDEGRLEEASWSEALATAAEAIEEGLDRTGPSGVAVIGGARLTNEDAYTWAKLAKGVVGTDHVDAQLGDGLSAEAVLGLPRATIDDVCAAGGTVLYLGPDPKEELPILFLRLRHAVCQDQVKLIELAPTDTGLSSLATHSFRYVPGTAADVCAQLVDPGTEPTGLDSADKRTAADLLASGPVTVVLGRPSLSESAATIESAAAVLLRHVEGVRFLVGLRRANVHGALDMGLAPGLLPGRVRLDDARQWYQDEWETLPAEPGLDTAGILAAAADGRIDTLVLLGADPLADFPDGDLARRGLAGARRIIATDLFLTESSSAAHVVLPAAGFAEVDGSTTNLEGRVSTVAQKVTPPGTARSDWMIAAELAFRLGHDLGLESPDDVWAEIERVAPAHAGIKPDLLRSLDAADGVLVPLSDSHPPTGPTPLGSDANLLDTRPQSVTGEPTAVADEADPGEVADAPGYPEAEGPADGATHEEDRPHDEPQGVSGSSPPERPALLRFDGDEVTSPRVPPVDSYSLRLTTTRKLYDCGTLVQKSPSLAHLAQPASLRINPYDLERLHVAGGGSVKVTSQRATATLDTVADPAVPRGTAALVVNQDGADPFELVDAALPVTDIRVETVGEAAR